MKKALSQCDELVAKHSTATEDKETYVNVINCYFNTKTKAWREEIDTFLNETCTLAWAMAVQQPPLKLEISGIGKTCDENIQRILPLRHLDYSKRMTVEYYLEPTLMQGDIVLEPGRVVALNSENNTTNNKQDDTVTVSPGSTVRSQLETTVSNPPAQQPQSKSKLCVIV